MKSAFFSILLQTSVLLPTCLLSATASADEKPASWKPLFDGKTLDGWKITNFGGEGDVDVEDGVIHMDFGSSLSGITYKGKFPKTNYEVRLEAMRVDGVDFFCGLTFPVAESHASFIVGGWGGAVVGISSINGKDASENDTTSFMNFKQDRWYRIRLRVTPEKLEGWIDDKQVVDQSIIGKKISTRSEVNLSKPFGISTWETRSAYRMVQIREIAKKKE